MTDTLTDTDSVSVCGRVHSPRQRSGAAEERRRVAPLPRAAVTSPRGGGSSDDRLLFLFCKELFCFTLCMKMCFSFVVVIVIVFK
ncbi:hypothetical protein F2P81_024760 [Scophthalmus maximus]|uniref:Uncharacterized protein n=1 Tax=Scophthalmus maximus TaxID=52904 RepID=A0A6A4RR88_SCOMX|nr:hypothetical protein F2P81_024760 [Scophthalmus maximus]